MTRKQYRRSMKLGDKLFDLVAHDRWGDCIVFALRLMMFALWFLIAVGLWTLIKEAIR